MSQQPLSSRPIATQDIGPSMMTPARAKDFRHIPDLCNANADGIPIFSFSNQALFPAHLSRRCSNRPFHQPAARPTA
jgi:hypothetical protein